MPDGIITPTNKDLEILRSARSKDLGRLGATVFYGVLGLYVVFLFGVFLFGVRDNSHRALSSNFAHTLALQHRWSDDLASDWEAYREWFKSHGTQSELFVFDVMSSTIVDSILNSNASRFPKSSMGSAAKLFIYLHIFSIRIVFIILAGFRLLIAVGVMSFVFGIRSFCVDRSSWLLGQMTNGRLFYSGARASLDSVNDDGSPDMLVRGLACPKISEYSMVERTDLGKVLHRYGVANPTNKSLAGIIHHYGDIPAYVGDAGTRAHTVGTNSLLKNTASLIESAMTAHESIVDSLERPNLSELSIDLARVLTDDILEVLKNVPAPELATLVLALEAAKVFSHSFEAGEWIQQSAFPHLSARAILHSLDSFPKDYDHYSRSRIRQGLIYAQRQSAFSEVRMPIAMRDDSWALRQWAEVLMATPWSRQDVANEVELLGILRLGHNEWCRDSANVLNALRSSGALRSGTDLVFVPVKALVEILTSCISSRDKTRLHEVLERVSLSSKVIATGSDEEDSSSGVSTVRFENFQNNLKQADDVARLHDVERKDLIEWFSLRYILANYGWLASRVGEYSVPTTSLIFGVFWPVPEVRGGNEHERLGKNAMVALRGSSFHELLGERWKSSFEYIERVSMADSSEMYKRLLLGRSPDVFEDMTEAESFDNGRIS